MLLSSGTSQQKEAGSLLRPPVNVDLNANPVQRPSARRTGFGLLEPSDGD
ncbi:MAG: hypothetical protein AAF974_05195 [Cyanobacteria bacterium P01_E01_bin.34]